MMFSKREKILIALLIVVVIVYGVSFVVQGRNYFVGKTISPTDPLSGSIGTLSVPQKLSNPPEIVKAVYVTGYSVGSKKYLDYLSNIFKTTEINSVVVDIKGSNGYVSYDSGVPDVKKYNLYNGAIKDIDSLVRFFHNKNIYVIGRIANFEDPMYSKARPELAIYNKLETTDILKPTLWEDNNKLSWLDPASKDVWDYNISLAKDVLYHGFDEINFDYVRFPSDGKADTMGYPIYDGKKTKADVIKEFFTYLRGQLKGEKISVDLFGQTTVNKDDMGIGQIIENAFENFDYISPMVYPSHYINGFIGFANPADHPYEIVKYSMDSGLVREIAYLKQKNSLVVEPSNGTVNTSGAKTIASVPTLDITSLAKFRPWLQDFNIGAEYTADMVKAEIKAVEDALGDNYEGFMLWNPSNIYTTGAVLKLQENLEK